MEILRKTNAIIKPKSSIIMRKDREIHLPLNKAAISRRNFILTSGAAISLSATPLSQSNASLVGDLIYAFVSMFDRLENLFKAAAEFAHSIGVEFETFRRNLEDMKSRNAIAGAYLETDEEKPVSGIVKQNVYSILPYKDGTRKRSLYKTLPTENVYVEPTGVTPLPIRDPLSRDEKVLLGMNNQEVWLRLQTAITETGYVSATT